MFYIKLFNDIGDAFYTSKPIYNSREEAKTKALQLGRLTDATTMMTYNDRQSVVLDCLPNKHKKAPRKVKAQPAPKLPPTEQQELPLDKGSV